MVYDITDEHSYEINFFYQNHFFLNDNNQQ